MTQLIHVWNYRMHLSWTFWYCVFQNITTRNFFLQFINTVYNRVKQCDWYQLFGETSDYRYRIQLATAMKKIPWQFTCLLCIIILVIQINKKHFNWWLNRFQTVATSYSTQHTVFIIVSNNIQNFTAAVQTGANN